jgi:hypothetical protein
LIALAAATAFGCGGSSAQSHGVAPLAAAPDDGLSGLTDQQLARTLMEVTGAGNLGKQVADGMMVSFRKMPNIPPAFIDRFKDNIRVDEMVDMVVPVYLKHYDRETMLAAIRFYQSKHGQAMVKALPAVTAECMEIGRAWGAKLARKTFRDLGVTVPSGP